MRILRPNEHKRDGHSVVRELIDGIQQAHEVLVRVRLASREDERLPDSEGSQDFDTRVCQRHRRLARDRDPSFADVQTRG
jgi:hypothetical protein